MQNTAISIAAGIGTPVLLAGLSILFTGIPDAWAPGTSLPVFVAAIFLLLGISVLPGISLRVYLIAIVLTVPAAIFVWALRDIRHDSTSQNLIGLVMTGALLVAVMSTAVVAPLYAIWRHLRLPTWATGIPLALCPILFFVAGVRGRQVSAGSATAAMKRMVDIRDAEREFAARNPGAGFTCVGTELPEVGGLNWRPVQGSSTSRDRSLTSENNYWFQLDCSSGVFELRAYPAWGSGNAGPRFFLRQDGEIGVTTPVP